MRLCTRSSLDPVAAPGGDRTPQPVQPSVIRLTHCGSRQTCRPSRIRACHRCVCRGYLDYMTDVVDSDELLRRMQRARACAEEEERTWRSRSDALRPTDPDGARDATVRAAAYQAVLRVLDEILTPGRRAGNV